LWLNGTGCSGVRAVTSQYCDRAKAKAPMKNARTSTTPPSATARNQVSADFEKICGTRYERSPAAARAGARGGPTGFNESRRSPGSDQRPARSIADLNRVGVPHRSMNADE
jgi:hypothetical protein